MSTRQDTSLFAGSASTLPKGGPSRLALLKASLKQFGREPERLTPNEQVELKRIVERQLAIESRLLATAFALQADSVVGPPSAFVEQLVAEPDQVGELLARGFQLEEVASALRKEQVCSVTLDLATANVAKPSEEEVRRAYDDYPEKFARPPQRQMAHILMTIPDDGSLSRETVKLTMEDIFQRLRSGADFAKLAIQFSQCPSALSQGIIGWVEKGKLFPTLDEAAFELGVSEISGILESPLGFHILRCCDRREEKVLSFESVRARIESALYESAKSDAGSVWLKKLLQAGVN